MAHEAIEPELEQERRRAYPARLPWYVDSMALARRGADVEALRPFTPTWTDEQNALRAEWGRMAPMIVLASYVLATAIITEATYVDQGHSQGYHFQPGLANDRQRDAWKQVVDAIHAGGALAVMQFVHAGALNQVLVVR